MCTHSPCSRSGIKHSLADINSSLVFQVCSCWYSNKNKDPPKRAREDAIMHRYPTLLIYPSTHCFGLGTIDSRDRMGRDSFIRSGLCFLQLQYTATEKERIHLKYGLPRWKWITHSFFVFPFSSSKTFFGGGKNCAL